MKLQADWLSHAGTIAVFDALKDHGAWFVGGCVRNGLMGLPTDDIDICTDAPPAAVMEAAGAAGLKVISTGIDHGTVTVVAEGLAHEITTLRRDTETDGRHATVQFSTDIVEDAARRDFTMNALYATRDGTVLDPNGAGIDDLTARRLRFIGNPEARIQEDYLRILRFFRFHAWYADPSRGIDAEALAACAAHTDGLAQLSAERITSEIKRLLRAPDPSPAVAAMDQAGVVAAVLPGASSQLLTVLTGMEADLAPDAMRRLAGLGGDITRLRLSKAEGKRLALYRAEMGTTTAAGTLAYLHGYDAAADIAALRAAVFEQPVETATQIAMGIGAAAEFPLRASDLPHLSGADLGVELRTLEQQWIDSGFTLTKAQLLEG